MSDEETKKTKEGHNKEIDSYKIERSLLTDAYFQLKETSKKLEMSEERFRRLAENAPDIIYRMSLPDGKYEYVSPAATTVFGYSAEEFYKNPELFKASLHPDWREYFTEQWNKLLAGEMPPTYEYQIVSKTGEVRWLNQRNILVRDKEGKPIAIEGIATDITENKKAEESRQSHLKYMESMDMVNRAIQGATDLNKMMNDVLNAVISILSCDTAKLVYPCDPSAHSWHISALQSIPGCPRAQVVGFEVAMTPRVAEEFRTLLSSPTPVKYYLEKESALLRDIAKSDQPKSVMSVALTPRMGKPWQFVVEQCSRKREWTKAEEDLFLEISKRLTDALNILLAYCDINENEAQMRTLIETIPDMIWLKDTHGVYLSCNPEFEKFFGAKEVDIIGKTDFDFVDKELAEFFLKKDLDAIAAGGPTINEEWVTYASDGHRALLETVKTPMRDASGVVIGVLGVARDITTRKKSEEEHEANLKFMESMDKVNNAILGTDDLDEMMSNVLDVVLRVMDCDRAWLLTPCDPWTLAYRVPMERTKPEWPGAASFGIEVPIDPDTTILFQKTRATNGPVEFNSGTDPVMPPELTRHFHIQSQLVMEIHPKVPESWMFGMHQCSYERVWTSEEKRLFQEIGRRIADSLGILLTYRNLKESEEKYSRIITTTAEGILIIDKDQKYTFVNPQMSHLLGYTEHELLGHKFDEFLLPEEMADHEHQMEERRKGNATVYERRFRRKDGSIVWCSVSGTPILDDKGEYNGSFGMVTDITERKQAEQRFMEQEKFSQSLLRFSRDLERAQSYGEILFAATSEISDIVGYTHVWAYSFTDDKKYAQKISAISPVEGTTKDVFIDLRASLVPISGDPMMEAIAAAKEIVVVADAQTDPTVNHEIVKELGNRTIVNIPVILFDRNLGFFGAGTFGDEGVRVPTKAEEGYFIAMASHIAVAFDRIRLLEERKKTEEQLRNNELKLMEAQRIGQFGNFDWVSDTDTTFWSEEFYRIHGLDPMGEPLGYEEYIKMLSAESAVTFSTAIKNTLETGEALVVDVQYLRPDGKRKWINIHGEAMRGEDNNIIGIRGTAQDVTEAKEIEKMRVDFLSLASHQLRTPLSGTRWLIETLEKGIHGSLTKGQVEYLDEIHKINERMTRLVSDMLTALRVESTEEIVIKKPISIKQLFDDLMLSVGATAKSRGIVIRDDSVRHATPKIDSDMNFLSIILSTFLSNAINYSHDGSEVIFDVVEEEGGVAFSVRDFGIGIPSDEQEHVYQRFFRAMNAKMVRPEGTGLGLYIANIIARKLNGTISFTSEVDKGSIFVLHLPQRDIK